MKDASVSLMTRAPAVVHSPWRLESWDDSSILIEQSGRRVRVVKPGREWEGAVVRFDDSSLVLKGEPPVVVPRSAIAGIDVRVRPSRKGRGVLVGVLAGAALGALLGMGSSGQDGLGIDAESVGAAAGAVVGAPVGGIVGWCVAKGPMWEPASVGATRSAPAALTRSIGLRLTLRF